MKWKARREHIIVHQDLMTGWTGKYSDEREFICRGGTYSTSLKNVSYNGKTSAVAATKNLRLLPFRPLNISNLHPTKFLIPQRAILVIMTS